MAAKQLTGIPGLDMEELKLEGFKVHKLVSPIQSAAVTGRRDFYKIGLVTGDMTIQSGDKILPVKGTVLFFVNPAVAHSVVVRSKKRTGYACVFTETFIAGRETKRILEESPLFRTGDSPRIALNSEQATFMTGIFQKMLAVHNEDYPFKAELIRHCIELIILEALRIQPSKNTVHFKNAATRITHLFLDLLERQFPIEHTGDTLRLRTPQDFAKTLCIHVNYLNRSVKQVTGKPVSVHIAARITAEAKALLRHTDWSVADIGYALGFEYPTYFNNFFKRQTGTNPKTLRQKKV